MLTGLADSRCSRLFAAYFGLGLLLFAALLGRFGFFDGLLNSDRSGSSALLLDLFHDVMARSVGRVAEN